MPAGTVHPLRTRTLPAALYIRVTADEGSVGYRSQEEAGRKVAEAHGWAVIDVYADTDLSPTASRPRPSFDRLVADIRSGVVKAVVVYHLDRLVRHNRELEPFMLMADELGLQLATVQGEIDLATKPGRTFARQLGAYARREREGRVDRMVSRHEADAAAGKPWRSGSRCYGYAPDGLTIIDDEAAIIRDMARRVLAGESIRSIAAALNTAGHRTPHDKVWHPSVVKRLLTNPRLIGQRVYRGQVTEGEWKPILGKREFARIGKALEKRAAAPGGALKPGSSPRKYLLTGGLLICSICGNPLSSQPTRPGKRGYVCRPGGAGNGCGKIRIAAEQLEQEVTEQVLTRLASPAIRRRLAVAVDGDDDTLPGRIARIDGELAALGIDFADGTIGRTEFHSAALRLRDVRKQLEEAAVQTARLQQLPGPSPEDLAEWWETADLPRRRDLVSLVLDHIVVGPATKRGPGPLDMDRLLWVWRSA